MKIVLGSTNKDKINILKEALAKLGEKAKITGVKVDSGVSEQPIGEKETIKGAINRARQAFSLHPEADLGIGLEGGLVKIKDRYFLVCIAALIDSQKNLYLGISSKWPLPQEVSQEIDRGGFFAHSIREYAKKNENSQKQKDLLQLLISRRQPFQEAIKIAFTTYERKW